MGPINTLVSRPHSLSENYLQVVSFKNVLLVEEAVGRGFGDVFREDVWGCGHVCDSTGQFDDTGAGTSGESHIVYDSF